MVIAGSAIAGAQGAPRLPARSTAQLLAAVDVPSSAPPAMQAVVQETANLGLPDLPGSSASDPLSGLSLLSGTHTFRIWYDGPTRVRIAIPVPMGEADVRRDGRDVWIWDSRTNQATHAVLPAGPDAGSAQETPVPSAPTPQQVARQILAAVGATTTVGLQSNVTVAGQAAYQLSLAPKDSRSLIGQVRIAVDAEYSLPLQVQIFARGASSPAFSVGYTSLSFTRPDPSNFPFTPPPGAKVKTVAVPVPQGLGTIAPPPPPGSAPGVPSEVIQNLGKNGGGFYNAQDGTIRVRCGPLRIPAGALSSLPRSCPGGCRGPRARRC
jgi:outer membrane lipoprotein-sorting protein